MLLKLEVNKKVYSIIFFAISALILLPFIYITRSDIMQAAAIVVLAIHLTIAFIYYTKGLALASMVFSYYIIWAFSVVIGLILNNKLEIPKDIDANFYNSIAILISVIFTMVIPIPSKIKRYISVKLNKKTIKPLVEEVIERSYGLETRKIESVDYKAYAQYKSTQNYVKKTYSSINTNPRIYRLRLILGGILITLGVIGLLIGSNGNDQAANFIQSWVFWMTISSLIISTTGLFIAVVGFIRALLVPLICLIIGGTGYYAYLLMIKAYGISMLLYYAYIFWLLIFVTAIIFYSYKLLVKNLMYHLTFYELNDNIYAVDLLLKDSCPITNYDKLAIIEVDFGDRGSFENFTKLNENCRFSCNINKLVFAGAKYQGNKSAVNIYIYYSTTKQFTKIERFFKRNLSFKHYISTKEDHEYLAYLEELYPVDEILIKMHNVSIIAELAKKDFDFKKEVPLLFVAVFSEKEDALKFMEDAKEHEYENAVYIDNTIEAMKLRLIQKYYHQVVVQKTMRLSKEWLNIETLKFYRLAKEHMGEYEFIDFGELIV